MPCPNYRKHEDYEPVAEVPADLKWKPATGRPNKLFVVMFSLGNLFKLMRSRETGAVQYFRLKDMGPERTTKEKLDEEPTRGAQVRYRVGTQCWFVEDNKWFLVEVVDRLGAAPGTGTEKRIIIKPVNELDADKRAPWPYGELLEFPAYSNNQLFLRLRPLRDRYK